MVVKGKWQQILIPVDLKKRLDGLKLHKNQAYWDVIDKYVPKGPVDINIPVNVDLVSGIDHPGYDID